MVVRPRVAVVGSINMDLVVRCDSLPLAGQTIAAQSAIEVCGGKGANQAVAAARSGADVSMIGRVGSDAFADQLLSNLVKHAVDPVGVTRTMNSASGLAIISVENSGQNAIMLVAGANGLVSSSDVDNHAGVIESADAVLLQLEIPTVSVLAAITVARRQGVRCVVDPAPVASDWTDKLLDVDLVCPNETEAESITGVKINSVSDAQVAASQLVERGAKNVAITLGEKGTLLLHQGNFHHVDAVTVTPLDTTAAGDSFAGALVVRWTETNDLVEAVRFANVAGAIATTRHGAQPSLATREEIETKRNLH